MCVYMSVKTLNPTAWLTFMQTFQLGTTFMLTCCSHACAVLSPAGKFSRVALRQRWYEFSLHNVLSIDCATVGCSFHATKLGVYRMCSLRTLPQTCVAPCRRFYNVCVCIYILCVVTVYDYIDKARAIRLHPHTLDNIQQRDVVFLGNIDKGHAMMLHYIYICKCMSYTHTDSVTYISVSLTHTLLRTSLPPHTAMKLRHRRQIL